MSLYESKRVINSHYPDTTSALCGLGAVEARGVGDGAGLESYSKVCLTVRLGEVCLAAGARKPVKK